MPNTFALCKYIWLRHCFHTLLLACAAAVEEFLAEVDNAYNLRDVFKIAAPTQQLDNDTAAATATAGDTTRGTSSSSAVGDMVAAFMSQVANSSQNALNDTTAGMYHLKSIDSKA